MKYTNILSHSFKMIKVNKFLNSFFFPDIFHMVISKLRGKTIAGTFTASNEYHLTIFRFEKMHLASSR